LKSDARREVFSHVPGPVWNDRYESLRAAWMAGTAGWGQALFLRQGLVAWMKTWPLEDAVGPRDGRVREAIDPGELSGELERQVTSELARIILHQHHHYHSHQEIAS
jgi:hypothetical protein